VRSIESTSLLAAFLLGAGCTTSVDEPRDDIDDDRAQIAASLRTMDRYEDDSIPMTKMRGLIDDGLYDPENVNPLRVGEMAPDFELMPLRFYDFGLDDDSITKETAGTMFEPVKLSAFRGKRPVVLIFGSYT